MREYAFAYGGLPDPGMSWRLFLCLLVGVPMFGARAQLRQLDATLAAIGAAFSDDASGTDAARSALERAAYGRVSAKRRWAPNLAAGGTDGEA